MLNMWQDLVTRKADPNDQAALIQLLQRKSFIHRHLGWESPLAWLDESPFYILESEYGIVAALAFPPDEDQITWLRLFAVRPGFSITEAWDKLWPEAISWMKENHPGALINSLVMNSEMQRLLSESGFREVYKVVVLVWNIAQAKWPKSDQALNVRDMRIDDFERVYEIDKVAFELIWRNSMSQLRAAYQEAFSAKVIDMDGKAAAYQISTINPHGGHLARLAVDPAYQKRGLATRLIAELLEDFQDKGFVEVTVNTQSNNTASLVLYQKFGFNSLEETYPVLQYKT
jgi:ribosomal-protein-alanine N-acetyltransferase